MACWNQTTGLLSPEGQALLMQSVSMMKFVQYAYTAAGVAVAFALAYSEQNYSTKSLWSR